MIRRDEITSDDVDVNVKLKLVMDDKVALLCISYLGIHMIPIAQTFKKIKIMGDGVKIDATTYYWEDIDEVELGWQVI